jgi:predicted nicotinamide N-methyase
VRPGDDLPACAHAGEDGTWRYAWPAGERFLSEVADLVHVRGRRVIDLGCGQGRLGLWAARAGAVEVVFADRSAEALTAIVLPCSGRILTHCWGEPLPACDVLLGGDILYRPPTFSDLMASIATALVAPDAVAWLVDPRRHLEPELSDHAAHRGLTWQSVRREAGYTLVRVARD